MPTIKDGIALKIPLINSPNNCTPVLKILGKCWIKEPIKLAMIVGTCRTKSGILSTIPCTKLNNNWTPESTN